MFPHLRFQVTLTSSYGNPTVKTRRILAPEYKKASIRTWDGLDAPDDGVLPGTYDTRKGAEHHERLNGSVHRETQQNKAGSFFLR